MAAWAWASFSVRSFSAAARCRSKVSICSIDSCRSRSCSSSVSILPPASAVSGLPISTSTHSMSKSRNLRRSSSRASRWMSSRCWSSSSIVFLWATSRK